MNLQENRTYTCIDEADMFAGLEENINVPNENLWSQDVTIPSTQILLQQQMPLKNQKVIKNSWQLHLEKGDDDDFVTETRGKENIEDVDAKKFIDIGTLYVPPEDWSKLVNGTKLNSTYVEYFVNLLSSMEISCVIKSGGYYRNKDSFVIRRGCCQVGCNRKYTVKQTPGSSDFILKRNCVPTSHQYQMTRPVRGPQRDIARSYLVNHLPSEYSVLANSTINEKLLEQGHLQNTVSDSTIRKMRDEALEMQQ